MNAVAERKEVTCQHYTRTCQENICPDCPDKKIIKKVWFWNPCAGHEYEQIEKL